MSFNKLSSSQFGDWENRIRFVNYIEDPTKILYESNVNISLTGRITRVRKLKSKLNEYQSKIIRTLVATVSNVLSNRTESSSNNSPNSSKDTQFSFNNTQVSSNDSTLSSFISDSLDSAIHHAFVLFETKGLYWSIEKNANGITIQISTKLEDVKLKFENEDRKEITSNEEFLSSEITLKDLIDMIKREEVNMGYGISPVNNCQGFAYRVCEFIAGRPQRVWQLQENIYDDNSH